MNSNILKILIVTFIFSLGTSCIIFKSSSSPGKSGQAPGQTKKATDSKSAKKHAPGQKKKKK